MGEEHVIQVSELTMTYQVKENQTTTFRDSLAAMIHPHYRQIPALKGISFQVARGDILGYVGENGAGKSTTIKSLLGILKPTAGTITVLGHDPFKHRKENAPRIAALMGQKSQLWWELPLMDSFKFLQKMYGNVGPTEDQWLTTMIERLEMTSFVHQSVRELSLGQRMRGEFVATFLHHPELVFLDEPTLGLDVPTRKRVLDFLLEINQREHTTIVFTSHEMADIEKVANRLLLLNHGTIAYRGDVQDFVGQYRTLRDIQAAGHVDPSRVLQPGVTIFRRNKESVEFLVDTTKVNDQQMLTQLSQLPDVTGVQFLPVNLETILAIRGERHD